MSFQLRSEKPSSVNRVELLHTPPERYGSRGFIVAVPTTELSRQCLDRRIPDKQILTDEVAAWQADRNKKHAKADWQFTTADARVRLKRLYPSL
jgi:hypothetical protein